MAGSGRRGAALLVSGAAIGGAFGLIAGLELSPGGPAFMTVVAVASAGYLAAVGLLAVDAWALTSNRTRR